jgi:uncharacterized membrane protein
MVILSLDLDKALRSSGALDLRLQETCMNPEVWGMTLAGIASLAAGLVLVKDRFLAASGAGRMVVLGPVFEAVALAMFAAEHFLDARNLATIVPHWLPLHLFWTLLVGTAWLAVAVSYISWRQVRWSAALTALLLLIFVVTLDLPNLPKPGHDRFFWILLVRETSFASGAMVLAGSLWRDPVGPVLMRVGRTIVGLVAIFYAIEHFLHPLHVPGVPLEKMTPAWFPAPVLLAYAVGIVLLAAGIGLLIPRTVRVAAATGGAALVVLTALFYVPIAVMEFHTPLAVEGLNYVGDTLLYAATILLAGMGWNRGQGTGDREQQATGNREQALGVGH